MHTPPPWLGLQSPPAGVSGRESARSQTADKTSSSSRGTPVTGDHRAGVRTALCHDIQTPSPWGCPSARPCSVASTRWAPTLFRITHFHVTGNTDALHAALLSWLEQEERKTAGRNRMRTIRALTKTAVHPDIA